MAITKRSDKGSPLSHVELDNNFQHLLDEQARTATTGSNVYSGSQIITGSVEVAAGDGFSGSFTGSFKGDGSNITGVTGEWDGSHTGNAIVSQTLTAQHLSSSGDIHNVGNVYLGNKLYAREDNDKQLDLLDSTYITLTDGYKVASFKSGSVVIGASGQTTDVKIYATNTDPEINQTGSVTIYGTTTISGSEYTNNKLDGLYVDGEVSGSGTGSFGEITLTAPNGTKWSFSTDNSGHLTLTGSQVL